MPRTLDYWILRTCERLHLPESHFHDLDYPEQARLIAYAVLREREDNFLPAH